MTTDQNRWWIIPLDLGPLEMKGAIVQRLRLHLLEQRTRFCKRKPWEPRMQRSRITVTQVAQKVRFDVSLREELLIASETGLAGGEEDLIDLRRIEARHRPAIETERSGRQDQVGTLQSRVPLRCRFHHLGVTLEELDHPWVVREQLRL
jgi:hypothetical protein